MFSSHSFAKLGAAFTFIAAFVIPGQSAPALQVDCAGQTATIVGTPGNDILVGSTGDDVIHGLGGNDTIRGRQGNDVLCGGTGRDTLYGGNGADALFGGADRDVLIGGFGPDSLNGGTGSDWVAYAYRGSRGMSVSLVSNSAEPNSAQQQLGGASGAVDRDTISAVENIIGSDGADILVGSDGHNTLRGRAGDDQIVPLRRGDVIDGGDGFDWIEYFPNNRGVTVNLKTGLAKGSGTDTIANVEAVWGTEYADTLAGDSADNYLYGAAGDDRLFGKVGVDRLEPGLGNDTLNGGADEDWAWYQFEASPVTVDIASGTASGPGQDVLVDVESVRGSEFADTLFGDSGPNYLIGGAGNDELRGRGGPDNLDPGTGNDAVWGGTDADWVYYWTHTSGVNIDLAAGTVSGSGADTLASVEAAVGSDHNDTIFGDSGPNSLWGFAGDDTVRGRGGDDFIQAAGGGANWLIGGTGHDILRFNLFAGPVTLDLTAGTSENNGRDNLFSIEGAWGTAGNDSLRGNAEPNTFMGLEGDDALLGREGNDILDGGAGTDRLDGGKGSDTCINGENNSSCEQVAGAARHTAFSAGPATAPAVTRSVHTAELLVRLFGAGRF